MTTFNPAEPRCYYFTSCEAQQLAFDLHLAGGPIEPNPATWRLLAADLAHLLLIAGTLATSAMAAAALWVPAQWAAVIVLLAGLALGAVAANWVGCRLPDLRDRIARRSDARYDLTAKLAQALPLPIDRMSHSIVRELAMRRRNTRAKELATPEMRPHVVHYMARYRPGLTDLSRWRLPTKSAM